MDEYYIPQKTLNVITYPCFNPQCRRHSILLRLSFSYIIIFPCVLPMLISLSMVNEMLRDLTKSRVVYLRAGYTVTSSPESSDGHVDTSISAALFIVESAGKCPRQIVSCSYFQNPIRGRHVHSAHCTMSDTR